MPVMKVPHIGQKEASFASCDPHFLQVGIGSASFRSLPVPLLKNNETVLDIRNTLCRSKAAEEADFLRGSIYTESRGAVLESRAYTSKSFLPA